MFLSHQIKKLLCQKTYKHYSVKERRLWVIRKEYSQKQIILSYLSDNSNKMYTSQQKNYIRTDILMGKKKTNRCFSMYDGDHQIHRGRNMIQDQCKKNISCNRLIKKQCLSINKNSIVKLFSMRFHLLELHKHDR